MFRPASSRCVAVRGSARARARDAAAPHRVRREDSWRRFRCLGVSCSRQGSCLEVFLRARGRRKPALLADFTAAPPVRNHRKARLGYWGTTTRALQSAQTRAPFASRAFGCQMRAPSRGASLVPWAAQSLSRAQGNALPSACARERRGRLVQRAPLR